MYQLPTSSTIVLPENIQHRKYNVGTLLIKVLIALFKSIALVTGIVILGIIAVCLITLVLVSLNILTGEQVSYITGDVWYVVRFNGTELFSTQLQGNYIQQFIAWSIGAMVQFVQGVLTLFA